MSVTLLMGTTPVSFSAPMCRICIEAILYYVLYYCAKVANPVDLTHRAKLFIDYIERCNLSQRMIYHIL